MRPAENRRAQGALLGLAVGDALGWPMEDRAGRVGGTSKLAASANFMGWRRREGGSYGPHEQPVRAGEVSDDTQLALAVTRSHLRGEHWLEHLTRVELPLWCLYERGGGGATKRAAQTWLRGRAPWASTERQERVRRYFTAGGNGTAMRCLPHCVASSNQYRSLAERLDLDATATHGHPRALVGSRVYGWAAWWAIHHSGKLAYGELLERTMDAVDEWGAPPNLTGEWITAAREHASEYERDWAEVVAETLHLLGHGREGLSQGAVAVDLGVLESMGAFGPSFGAGTVTAAAAVFLASRYVTQPQQGLLTAAFARGADTDTLAAMTAGLLGCLVGDEWLWPLAEGVQDVDYIGDLTQQLLGNVRKATEPPFTTRSRTQLYRWLDQAAIGDTIRLEPFGRIEVVDLVDYETRPQFVRAWGFRSEDGQTLLIKRYDKGREGRPRWRALDTTRGTSGAGGKSEEPRAGLVLRVSDLDRAREFYEGVVGLEVKRTSPRYVSYGWLALEPGVSDDKQLPLSPEPIRSGAAIRVYMVAEAVSRAHNAITDLGLKAESLERNGKPVLRTADPDGHSVEFCVHNGTPPPV